MTYKRFGDQIAGQVSRAIQATYELDRAAVRQVLSELIFDKPPAATPEPALTPYEVFLESIQFKYVEIGLSRENLMSVAHYLPRIPSIKGVAPTVQLRYHITNYMNEIYILKNRLLAFLTYLERIYRNGPWGPRLKPVIVKMRKDITDMLNGIITTRGEHVHDAHFEDKQLFRLSFLEYASRELGPQFTPEFKSLLRSELRDRRRWIRETNRQVKGLIDSYFAALSVAIFEKNGEVRLPQGMKRLTRRCS